MDVADLAALAAAYHCPANTVIENLGTVNHCFFLLVFLFFDFYFCVGLFFIYFGKSCLPGFSLPGEQVFLLTW
jgi:hypothetical protein